MREAFPARRAAAYQAWYEHMPVRPSRLDPTMAIQIYGTTDWGRLARFYVLDTRQYRSVQVCPALPDRRALRFREGPQDPVRRRGRRELHRPERVELQGVRSRTSHAPCSATAQERWLDGALAESGAAWNLLAQNVMVMTVAEGTAESPRHYSDAWAGYPPARERLFGALAKHRTANPVVLTGDIHSFWVNDLANAAGRPAGVELVTSSIATSTYDKSAVLPLNPGAKFHDGTHNGYVRCELTRERCARTSSRSPTAPTPVAPRASPRHSRSDQASHTHDASRRTEISFGTRGIRRGSSLANAAGTSAFAREDPATSRVPKSCSSLKATSATRAGP